MVYCGGNLDYLVLHDVLCHTKLRESIVIGVMVFMEYLFVDDVKHKVIYVNFLKNYVYYSYKT